MNSTKHQIGGTHYKDLAIQPVEYIHKNNLGFIEGCVVKYVTRWKSKGGTEDLKKARHFLDLLIDMETDQTVEAVMKNLRKEHSRIDLIGQNGNDGLHYDETDTFYTTTKTKINNGAF